MSLDPKAKKVFGLFRELIIFGAFFGRFHEFSYSGVFSKTLP